MQSLSRGTRETRARRAPPLLTILHSDELVQAQPARGASVASVVRAKLLTVVFGPSRSKRFGKAVAEAQGGAGECSELEPGRYRVRFVLGEDAADYLGLARLLERVRHWRASEVSEEGEPVSTFHAREMAWCASSQLSSFRACRMRFYWGIHPKCSLCPLFDSERAVRDALGENPPPGLVFEISFGPNLRALMGLPPNLELDWQVPDYLPAEWGGEAGEEPAG